MSKKLTRESRAALQSVRAKCRKALAVNDAPLTKPIIAHLQAVVSYVDTKLGVKIVDDAAPAADDGDTTPEAATA